MSDDQPESITAFEWAIDALERTVQHLHEGTSEWKAQCNAHSAAVAAVGDLLGNSMGNHLSLAEKLGILDLVRARMLHDLHEEFTKTSMFEGE